MAGSAAIARDAAYRLEDFEEEDGNQASDNPNRQIVHVNRRESEHPTSGRD
jgi:hypothetical protein